MAGDGQPEPDWPGPLPNRSIHELSACYGLLMSLWFGSFPIGGGSSVD
ncbi:hypothetical protein ACP4OV_030411 [Aristida adscensionis]